MDDQDRAYNIHSPRVQQLQNAVAGVAVWTDSPDDLATATAEVIGRDLDAETVIVARWVSATLAVIGNHWTAEHVPDDREPAQLLRRLIAMASDGQDSEAWCDVTAVDLGSDHGGSVLVVSRPERPFDSEEMSAIRASAATLTLALGRRESLHRATSEVQRLEQLAALKEDFVAEVSHELRTPLTSIIGSLQTLMRPEFAPRHEGATALITAAVEQTRRLRRMVEDLLLASQIDGVGVPVRPRLIRPDQLVTNTVASLPGTGDRVTVRGATESALVDDDHLRRIVTNLVDNAVRHAPNARVTVSTTMLNGNLEIVVADNGPGLPEERSSSPFLGDPAGPAAGLGLGLRITRGLVEAMGGTIDYQGSSSGAIFLVRVPATAMDGPSRAA